MTDSNSDIASVVSEFQGHCCLPGATPLATLCTFRTVPYAEKTLLLTISVCSAVAGPYHAPTR